MCAGDSIRSGLPGMRIDSEIHLASEGAESLMAERIGTVTRNTKETRVLVEIRLDGSGKAELNTGVPFLDHMLTLFAVHGIFDLKIEAAGDLEVDSHHTVEDVGICLGMALSKALGDRTAIARYGHASIPMDEALASVSLDLSNRPFLVYETPPMPDKTGEFETALAPEFFRALSQHGGVTLHINVPYGANAHHILEAAFKAFARALAAAVSFDPRRSGIPSSKGAL